jgi:hypothetical protein
LFVCLLRLAFRYIETVGGMAFRPWVRPSSRGRKTQREPLPDIKLQNGVNGKQHCRNNYTSI